MRGGRGREDRGRLCKEGKMREGVMRKNEEK